MNIACEARTLSNGLDVIVHANPLCPIVAINLWYHVGSENAEDSWQQSTGVGKKPNNPALPTWIVTWLESASIIKLWWLA